MNYENLKATIAANIYQNGRGEVTAKMVKTAMNEVVDTIIAGGFLYKGVAHPGDAAVTPDANVFYLATEVGTYTNKGGLQVADGEVAVLKYNGSWTKEVTGAATAAEVAALGQKVDVLIAGEETVNTTTDDYTPTSYQGNAVEDPRQILPVGAHLLGVTLLSTGTAASGASELRIYNSSRELVKTVTLEKIGTTDTYMDFSDENIIVKEGYHYGIYRVGYKWVRGLSPCVNPATGDAYTNSFLGLTWRYQQIVPAYAAPIQALQEDVAELNEKDEYIEKIDLVGVSSAEQEMTITEGYFITTSGTLSSNSDFAYSGGVSLTKGQTIILKARGYLTNVVMISKVITAGSSYQPLVRSVDSTIRDYTFVVAEDGNYAFSFNKHVTHKLYIVDGSILALNKAVKEQSDNIGSRLYCGIPTVGIIGDSMSCGAGYNPNDGQAHEYPQYSWWKYLERESGMTYRRFARGGQSTKSFLTDNDYGLPATLTSANFCKLYVIALEINDRTGQGLGPSYLGTSADIDLSDPDNNADSYYGNYARIIQKITAANPQARFMLFTNPRTDSDFNDAIRTIAEMFSNCYLVDLYTKYGLYFGVGGFFHRMQDASDHYPSFAYQGMSKIFSDAMDECIANNVEGFASIQY